MPKSRKADWNRENENALQFRAVTDRLPTADRRRVGRGPGGTYEIVNPATEQVVGQAPERHRSADAERGLRAAAAEAFAGVVAHHARGAGRAARPGRRPARRARRDELVPLVQAETGATMRVAKTMQVPQASARFRRYARGSSRTLVPLPPAIMPTTALAPGGIIGARRAPGPGRRGGLHHVLQLPDHQHGRQDRPGPGHGQHGRGQAAAPGPARPSSACASCSRRPASRRAWSTSWLGDSARGGRGASSPRPHVDMVSLHRLDRAWAAASARSPGGR